MGYEPPPSINISLKFWRYQVWMPIRKNFGGSGIELGYQGTYRATTIAKDIGSVFVQQPKYELQYVGQKQTSFYL